MSSRQFSGSLVPGALTNNTEYLSGVSSGNTTRVFMRTTSGRRGAASIQMNILVSSSPANTFTASTGTNATVVTQGMTITGVRNTEGNNADFQNSTTFAIYIIPELPPFQIIPSLTYPNIIELFGPTTMTLDQAVSAINNFSAAANIVTASGSGSSTFVDSGILTLSGAVNSSFDTTTGIITSASVNGTQFPGQTGALTISSGTLPAGYALATNYATYFANSTYTGTGFGSPTQFQLFTTAKAVSAARQTYNNGWAPPGTTGLIIPTTGGSLASATVTFTPVNFVTSSPVSGDINDTLIGPNMITGNNARNISQNNIVIPSNSSIAPPVALIFAGANATFTGVSSVMNAYVASPYHCFVLVVTSVAGSYVAQIIGKA